MKRMIGVALTAILGICGCGPTAVETAGMPPTKETVASAATQENTSKGATAEPVTAAPANGTAPVAVPLEGGQATLTPENTKVEFVGVHLPPKAPDPRTGGFEKLSGKAKLDPAGKGLAAVSLEIDATSLWTEVGGRLTDHLKSPDFLEVREYPTIKFESTKIEPGEGQSQITGQLTMHGITKEISFPTTVQIGENGLTLRSEFSVDRLDFGVKYRPDEVGKEVKITAVVGERTQPRQGGGGFGGKGRGKGKRGGGGEQPSGKQAP